MIKGMYIYQVTNPYLQQHAGLIHYSAFSAVKVM